MMAREKGLEPLADLILAQPTDGSPEGYAARFLSDQVADVAEALQGARDILAERISEHANVRAAVREKALRFGRIRVEKVKEAVDEKEVYQSYYDFATRVDRLQPHQTLAITRGETESILRVHIDVPERDWIDAIQAEFEQDILSPFAEQLDLAIQDAAERLLLPAIERDVRRAKGESADNHAIQVFANNLRALLSQPPLAHHVLMGIDPGFRTGCKVAVVDATGKLLDTGTIYPHEPRNDWQGALHDSASDDRPSPCDSHQHREWHCLA